MPAPAIRYQRGGVYLPELRLWLDAHEARTGPDRVFVSHAHSDHTAAHREVILSEVTSKLMQARLGGERIEHQLTFGQPASFEAETPFTITLLPAGHILGSAMAFIEARGSSLLYTGDFKLRKGLSAELCAPRPADTLIMETTYGRPQYQFPPTDGVMQGIIRFCREALDNDETAVLMGYSLGKSQELLRGLADAGLPLVLHDSVFKLTQIYEHFGQSFPPYTKFEEGSAAGKVLVCPPSSATSPLLRNLGRTRTAVLTGWAVDPNCRFRYQAQAAFPLSDHADFNDLLDLVKQVAPKKILTLHGFAADFAQTLRDLGYDAQALSEDEQLALPLRTGARLPPRPESKLQVLKEALPPIVTQLADASPSAFYTFAAVCAAIGNTTKKLEKVRILSDYLKTLELPLLGSVNTWLTGNPFAPSQNKVLQLGWSLIRDALCQAGALDQAQFGQIYLKHSDLGETAFEILTLGAPAAPVLSVANVESVLQHLYSARGPLAKLPVLVKALRQCAPLEGKYLLKILTGDLRIGLKEGLLEEAIADAFAAPLDEVKNANLLLGNIGETAQLAQRGQLQAVTLMPFRPVKYMLASPEETAADVWKRVLEWSAPGRQKKGSDQPLSPIVTTSELFALQQPVGAQPPPAPTVWIEDKYDGIRAQLHKVGNRVALFSRDLKEITNSFLDLADAARQIKDDFIIDGEIIAMRGDQVQPFAELQKRLGRREGDLFMGEQIPVRFITFDLLWHDNQSYLNQPLALRRSALERFLPATARLSMITQVKCAEDIESAFAAARARGNEGLMIKDPASVYTPGRRGLAWLKLKKAFATLDCVVVGAEYGNGKRKAVLSDYTFAVRDETTGQLKTIGKAYSGLTDAEIGQLTTHFLSKAIRQRGRHYEVEPDTVLEIAFDLLQPSTRHDSGLAMRFPRIVRIRSDKAASEIDTLATAWRLVKKTSDTA